MNPPTGPKPTTAWNIHAPCGPGSEFTYHPHTNIRGFTVIARCTRCIGTEGQIILLCSTVPSIIEQRNFWGGPTSLERQPVASA